MFEQRSLSTLLERQIGGGTPPRSNPAFWNGPIPWASVKDFEDASLTLNSTAERISQSGLDASTANLIPAGTPLVCTRMAVGRCAITTQPVAINQDVRALTPKAEVQPRYLLRLLDFLRPAAESQAVGSTVKGIRTSDYLAIKVPVAPAIEQPVIARILDTLDTQIEKTQALIAKLEQVKEGLLQDLLTRGVDENGELRPSAEEAPELYKESALGLIPREWDVQQIENFAEVLSGGTPSRTQLDRYFTTGGSGIPWVKTLDLNEQTISKTDEQITPVGLKDSSCALLPAGTVLVAMYGGWEQIGRTGRLGMAGACNQAISALVPKSAGRPQGPFLLYALQHGRSRWRQVAASTRKDPNITKLDVLSFLVPLPPSQEQQMVATRYEAILARIAKERNLQRMLAAEKSGLMDDLLTGRVRVTPLLDREPAEAT
jgi:type I restriction enzyme S subunit